MSTTDLIHAARTATSADCARLWATIQKDFIPTARIEIIPVTAPSGVSYLRLELLDDSAETLDGYELVNVWSCREFANQLHLISMGQLFDLLIVGYRQMEAYFELGEQAAPTRRRK